MAAMTPLIRNILTLFLLFLYLGLFAQSELSLAGLVKDATSGSPIAGVNLIIKGTTKGTTTNEDGHFEISNLSEGTHTLIISFIGYTTKEMKVKLNATTKAITVSLAPATTELTEVVVKGETEGAAEERKVRTNVMPVTIITASQIENRAGNLNEILARQAGVQIRMSGGLGSDSRISVRGLEGKRVQIFLDGNPLNTPDGSLGINDLPVQIIERIEIYKGSVPAYLGGDGLGSAVNVVLRHRDVSYIDATVSRQTYNTQALGLILKNTFDKQGIEVGGGVFDTRSDNDYVMQSPYQPGLKIKRDHDKYRSLLAGAAIRFHKFWFDEIELEGALVLNDKEIQGIQQNIQGVTSNGKARVASLSLTKNTFAKNKLGLRYNFLYGSFDIRLVDTLSHNYDWDGTEVPSRIGKGELGSGPNLSLNRQEDFRQRLNLEYRISSSISLNLNNTSRYVTFDPNDDLGNEWAGKNIYNYPGSIKNTITGLTLENRFKNSHLMVSSAVKHYYNQVEGYNTSIYLNNSTPDPVSHTTNKLGYVVGGRYNISQALFLKASHERGVRLPNRTELFGDGILITPSTGLVPEVSYNFNMGAVYDRSLKSTNRIQLEANAFYMYVDNLIQLAGNGLTLGYVNYAKASITGADLELKWDATQNLYASVNGTYQYLKDINRLTPSTSVPNPTYGLAIPNIPQLFFNWNAEYHRNHTLGEHSKTRVIYDGSFVNSYNFGFAISVYDRFTIPAYLTHTLAIEQSFKNGRYTITGEANNITDEVVINNFNQPLMGRTFRIKVRYLLLGDDSYHQH
jgi:vitamin B12 transporter